MWVHGPLGLLNPNREEGSFWLFGVVGERVPQSITTARAQEDDGREEALAVLLGLLQTLNPKP